MKLLPPIDGEVTPLPSDLGSAENMRRAMRRISERLLAMAADIDVNLGHAIRDQARHFGEAMLRKAKELGSEGWARTAETVAEQDRPLAITLGLYVRSRREAVVANRDQLNGKHTTIAPDFCNT